VGKAIDQNDVETIHMIKWDGHIINI
jgi:hypothetical protein